MNGVLPLFAPGAEPMPEGPVIRRAFSMPTRHTFTMRPLRDLLARYVRPGLYVVDPCAGFNSPATITNDLNPEAPTDHHVDAREFAKIFEDDSVTGLLFDPPYSPRQISECYRGIGLPVSAEDTQNARLYAEVKDAFAGKIHEGGFAICCGWNSQGFGKRRGFVLTELLLIPHGGAHNDTIVTVERRIR